MPNLDIYEPAEDSELLKNVVAGRARRKRVLDMGTGSGIQARAAQEAGALSVLAVDINPAAVAFVTKHHIPARVSNLFSHVTGTFDLIIFNPPYLPLDAREDSQSALATTGGEYGDEILLLFFRQAMRFLAPKGSILILVSSLTRRDRLSSLLKSKNLQKRCVARTRVFMEELEVWEVRRMHAKAKS